MIKHIVLLNFKQGTSDEAVENLTTGFKKLKNEIEEIQHYEFGKDAGIYRSNASYVLIAEFKTEADLKTYVKHPLHQALLSDIAGPLLESFQSIQLNTN